MEQPSGTAGCLMRLRSLAASSTSGFMRLAGFIVNNPDRAVGLTMEQLAQQSDSSYATIYRLCIKMGFTGYKDFKTRLIEDLMLERGTNESSTMPAVDESSGTDQILDSVFSFAAKTLADCRTIMDVPTMEGAVAACLAARRMLIIGAGTSGIAAQYAYIKLARLGFPCHAVCDGMFIAAECAILDKDDVLLAVSSSGRTVDIVAAAQEAKQRGCTVVSISDYAVSPLSAVSDMMLHTTPRNASLYRDIEMPLLCGQIAVIDSLFSCIAVRMGVRGSDRYQLTRVAVERKRR